ncbi:MAG: HDOD domain-containing protein, partial [Rhodoferax sp.]
MSTQTLQKVFAAMRESRGFPTLERTVNSVLGDLNAAVQDQGNVARCIVEDLSLTQKVLKLANSQMYAPFAPGASCVSSALGILGPDALLHLVLGTALMSDAELQADDNLSRSFLASELARGACPQRSEDASIATLMYDLGRLMATRYLPTEALVFESQLGNGVDEETAADKAFGMTLQELGTQVAKHWNLPAPLLASIDGSGDPTLVAVARFSSKASGLIRQGRPEALGKLLAELDVPGIHKDALTALVQRKVDEVGAAAAGTTAASTEQLLGQLFDALEEEKKASVEELAGAMFPALGEYLKTAHCLLFMQTRSGDYRVRYGAGKGIDELKSKLRISAEFQPTAFHAVIKNNVDV